MVQESLKESRISNYEFCCCLVGVLMKVSSGSALIIDKQPNDGVYAKRHSQEANWTQTKDLAAAHIHAQSEASTSKASIEGRRGVFCANLVDLKILRMKQHKIVCERKLQNWPENGQRMHANDPRSVHKENISCQGTCSRSLVSSPNLTDHPCNR